MTLNVPHAFYDAIRTGNEIGKAKASAPKTELSIKEVLLYPDLLQKMSSSAQARMRKQIHNLEERQLQMAQMRGPKLFQVEKPFTIETRERFWQDSLKIFDKNWTIEYSLGPLVLWPTEVPTESDHRFSRLFAYAWAEDAMGWIITDAKVVEALRKEYLQERDYI